MPYPPQQGGYMPYPVQPGFPYPPVRRRSRYGWIYAAAAALLIIVLAVTLPTVLNGRGKIVPTGPTTAGVPVPESEIWGTTELSRYLGEQMVAGTTNISLSGFGIGSIDEVWDAWMEACYQNPMCLTLNSAEYYESTKNLKVEYAESQSVRESKQAEIRAVVDEFVSQYYSDALSAIELVYLINNYICDRADYDFETYEYFEKTGDYREEDNDSWTPYGVLVNRKGVCESYADAFNVLARACGLESIMVIGYVDGNTDYYHAWNRVNVGGQWVVVDATSNDTSISGMALGLSDETAALYLSETDEWVEDSSLYNFRCTTGEYEYYARNGKMFGRDDIASQLARDYEEDGYAALRTDPLLTEQEAEQIINDVANAASRPGSFVWYYYLGVFELIED